jgi:hypothetical protein
VTAVIDIIVIATPSLPPTPWQHAWSTARDRIPGLPGRLEIARAASGTPIPGGARVVRGGWRPAATAAQADAVRAHYEREADGGDGLHAELASRTLADPAELERQTVLAIGVPHPLAWCAPLEVTALDEACRAIVDAQELWTSSASCGVIRASQRGYQVWTGIGSTMRSVGHASDYDSAEAMLVEASQRERAAIARDVGQVLAGWSPTTPYYSATLEDYQRRLPLQIRRGPVSGGGSSWDLPVVATWRDGVTERHPWVLAWDDEAGRAAERQRQREGERRAAERRN